MKKLLTAIAVTAGLAIVTAPTAVHAGASVDSVDIRYTFQSGPNSAAAASNTSFEIFDDDGVEISAQCSTGSVFANGGNATVSMQCSNLSDGDYTLGASGVEGFGLSEVTCRSIRFDQAPNKEFDDPNATFTHVAGQTHDCSVTFLPEKIVYVDTIVDGGTAVHSDFDIEVYDADGGSVIASTSDPSDLACDFNTPNGTDCGRIDLLPGTYFLGATDVAGYVPSSVTCADAFGGKQFDPLVGEVTISNLGDSTVCTITMRYVTQTLSIDIDLVNDNFGTATADDFTIEVYDSNGTLAASGVDPEPGPDNASFEATLPVGDYTLGVEGPEGYDVTVTVTEVPVQLEKLLDPAAPFTLAENIDVVVAVQVDDSPDTTTTTAAPATTAPTTTVAETTTTVSATTPPVTTTAPAPPTTIEPTSLLPATGSESTQLMLVAITLLMLGGGAVLATRRS